MPSALIHVYTGRIYSPGSGIPFYIGTLAPDCISSREEKDLLHLRLSKDRPGDLLKLKRAWGTEDEFRVGALLHLFTDYLWDNGPMEMHKRSYTGNTWFTDYRWEINLASCYMYRQFDWAPDLWVDMCEYPAEGYSSLKDYPPDKIKSFIEHNRYKLETQDIGPSPAFPPDLVEKFCRDAAKSFGNFITSK